MNEGRSVNYLVVGAIIVLFSAIHYVQARRRDIDVPAIGPSGRITSFYGAFKYLSNAKSMLDEGIQKYGSRPFKIPQFGRWHVVVNSPEHIEEVRSAPDDKLSFREATNDILAIVWTMGKQIAHNPYHVSIIRSQLTRNLGILFDDVKDEVINAFEDFVPAVEDDWLALPGHETIIKIVCRASNRVFVGLPLCRNEDFCQLNAKFTMDVVLGTKIMSLFPDFLKPLVGEFLTSVPRSIRRSMKHLRPTIEFRIRQHKEHGKSWPDKPVDVLSWLIDEAPDNERTVEELTRRILTLNFAAIHTSAMSFTHTLFHLAARPQYIEPLREEVEGVVREEGWSKTAMTKMAKLDSFLRESQRYNSISMLSMTRKALVDFRLSDDTLLPAGTFVSCNATMMHFDDNNYPNAREFDGFRFANANGDALLDGGKGQFVSTGIDYLPFGHGRHACPGRFFVANELKLMLAYIVLAYDIKLENEGVRPDDMYFGQAILPNPKAKVLFRKRRL